MRRRGFLLGAFVLLLAIIAVVYLLRGNFQVQENGFAIVPQDAPVIFEWSEPAAQIPALQGDSLWGQLKAYGLFQRVDHQWADLLTLFPEKSLEASGHLWMSVHRTGASSYGLLWVVRLQRAAGVDVADSLAGAAHREYQQVDIWEGALGTGRWAAARIGEMWVCSTHPLLVETAIDQSIATTSLADDASFAQVQALAGRNNRPKMYLQMASMPQLLKVFAKPSVLRLEAITQFARWVVVEYDLVNTGIFVNGYVVTGMEGAGHLTNLLPATEYREGSTAVLPFNTAAMYTLHSRNLELIMDAADSLAREWYTKHVINWIGQEVALAIVEPYSSDFASNVVLVAAAHDTAMAQQHLHAIATSESIQRFKGFTIFQLKEKPGWERAFGFKSRLLDDPYVLFIDNYVIFAASAAQAKVLIERYLNEQTLDKNMDYLDFRQKMVDHPAINMYVNTQRSYQLLQAVAGPVLAPAITTPERPFFILNPIGIQIAPLQQQQWLISGMLQVGTHFQESTNLLWKAELDTLPVGSIHLVKNHDTDGFELLVQDAAHTLYLIDAGGKVLWQRILDGPIVGPVHQVDYYRNGKLQYLFTTRKSIQLIDRLGRDVENFPLTMAAEVTSGLAVFDYLNNGKFRMFVGCANGLTYGFYKSGKPLPGWSPKKEPGVLPFPLQHNVVGTRDYIIATSVKGEVEGFARNGTTRIPPRKLKTQFLQPFELHATSRRAFELINADTNGILYFLDDDNHLIRDTITDCTGRVSYAFRDINGDDAQDHVFLDQTHLKVLDQEGKMLMLYELPERMKPALQFFTMEGRTMIGTVGAEQGKIYLLTPDGTLMDGFPLPGEIPFVFTNTFRPGEWIVATGLHDNTITVYRLQ